MSCREKSKLYSLNVFTKPPAGCLKNGLRVSRKYTAQDHREIYKVYKNNFQRPLINC